jgi:hypothetical protein
MHTVNPIGRHDPHKMIRLVATRPLFFNGQRVEIGSEFQVEAQDAPDVLVTLRAKFADENDRPLVYKRVELF